MWKLFINVALEIQLKYQRKEMVISEQMMKAFSQFTKETLKE
jgi:hypothetical protein